MAAHSPRLGPCWSLPWPSCLEIGVWSWTLAPKAGACCPGRVGESSCVCLGWGRTAQSPPARRKLFIFSLLLGQCLTALSENPLQRLAITLKKIIPSAGAGAPSALAVGRLTLSKQSAPEIPRDSTERSDSKRKRGLQQHGPRVASCLPFRWPHRGKAAPKTPEESCALLQGFLGEMASWRPHARPAEVGEA